MTWYWHFEESRLVVLVQVIKHLSNTYSVPDPILGSGETEMKQTQSLLWKSSQLRERDIGEHVCGKSMEQRHCGPARSDERSRVKDEIREGFLEEATSNQSLLFRTTHIAGSSKRSVKIERELLLAIQKTDSIRQEIILISLVPVTLSLSCNWNPPSTNLWVCCFEIAQVSSMEGSVSFIPWQWVPSAYLPSISLPCQSGLVACCYKVVLLPESQILHD